MGSNLSPEDKAFFEEVVSKAEPYPEDAPEFNQWDGKRDHDRALATLAKKALEGRLK